MQLVKPAAASSNLIRSFQKVAWNRIENHFNEYDKLASVDHEVLREGAAHAMVRPGGGTVSAHIEEAQVVAFTNWRQ